MKRYLNLLPALLYMALIFCLSSRPAPEALQAWPILWGMKVVHLVEYGVLAVLWYVGLRRATAWSPCAVGLVSVALTFAWGISDEIHQAFVPGRTARVEDIFTDLVGAVAATWLWRALVALRRAHASGKPLSTR